MKVIRQLRIKIIISIISIQMLILLSIFMLLNLVIYTRENNASRQFLQKLSVNGGHDPDYKSIAEKKDNPEKNIFSDFLLLNSTDSSGFTKPASYNLRNYFSVNFSYTGVINEVIQDYPLNYTNEEINEIVLNVFNSGKTSGHTGFYYFLIIPAEYGNHLMCIHNRRQEFAILQQLCYYSFLILFISLIVTSIISFIISKIVLKNTAQTFEKQKQFIADAGHELKTPIAVISANIDVLESDQTLAENKFFKYIKQENQRMSDMVKDLLYLARDDAERLDIISMDFDFSNAVENAILPFEVVAFESGMELTIDIEKGMSFTGEEKSIKQVCVILLDNAIKNSDKGAKISVQSYKDNQKLYFKVRNTGNGISKEDLQKIFLRFYRSDSSRARKTGGYGLGLAIAQTIAKKHSGTLTAESQPGEWAEFTLTLPRKVKKA